VLELYQSSQIRTHLVPVAVTSACAVCAHAHTLSTLLPPFPSTFIHWAVAIPNSLYLSIESRGCILPVIYTFSCRACLLPIPATVLVLVRISSPSSHFDHTSLPFHTLYSLVLLRLCIHDILSTVSFPVDNRPPPPSFQSGAPYSTYFHAHGTPLFIERASVDDDAEQGVPIVILHYSYLRVIVRCLFLYSLRPLPCIVMDVGSPVNSDFLSCDDMTITLLCMLFLLLLSPQG
jgi:hypothetical protein